MQLFGTDITLALIWNIIRVIIDLGVLWVIIYLVISVFNEDTRTMQLFKGVLIILLFKLLTSIFGFTALDFVVDLILNWGGIAIIVIFQPEIRNVLENMGRTHIEDSLDNLSSDEVMYSIDELVAAITELSKTKTGALITFEQSYSLADYINTGIKINSEIKAELITTIFYEGTPLHDGAIIIKDNMIVCASAFFTPTKRELSPIFGARHRAGLGISETTDSLTVIVSEETGTISYAKKGILKKIQQKELKAILVNELGWLESVGEQSEQ